MPLQPPDLAGKTYKDIMDEMLASIPKYSDTWTNLNPSDPGITILELLSWNADMTLYRINRMPEESYVNFLRLVAGTSGLEYVNRSLEKLKTDPNSDRMLIRLLEFLKDIEKGEQKEIPEIKAAALDFLNSNYRAMTKEDFERLSIETTENDIVKVKRAIVISDGEKVEVIIVSDPVYRYNKDVYDDLIKKVKGYLYPRRLIGTRIVVKSPAFTRVKIEVKVIYQYQYHDTTNVEESVRKRILEYLDPLTGGHEGKGWTYKRSLTVYEIDQIVEEMEGIDRVKEVIIDDFSGDSTKKEIINIIGLIEITEDDIIIEEVK
jgi:hypothetical protein